MGPMRDIRELQNISPEVDIKTQQIKPSGVKNPIYFRVEHENRKSIYGKSNNRMNEFLSLKDFRAEKMVANPNATKIRVFKTRELWESERAFDTQKNITN
jgi:hypothetical protein